MAFSAIITLTGTVGVDVGPFNLYSNTDTYTTPFETSISRTDLINGYTSTNVPTSTATVRVKSTGNCTNYLDIEVTDPDPNVEVYSRCGSFPLEYYYILSSSGVDTLKAEDTIARCYLHENSGTLTAMQAIYTSMTELSTLVTSSCECI
jgi:hypothetical protein